MARKNEHSAPKSQQTPQIIKDARLLNGLTLEKLAEDLGVSDRVVKMWETGKRSPKLSHREKLVDALSIPRELLGLQEQTDFSVEEALSLLKNTRLSFYQGTLMAALSKADLLVRNLSRQVRRGDANLRPSLIHALYLKGTAVSIVENNPFLALKYFKAMERLTSKIGNEEWLYIAWMYQAEMYRRMREYQRAHLIFKKVAEGLTSDCEMIGHYQQLLSRVCIALDDVEGAMEAMGEAEKCALIGQGHNNSYFVFCDLCSIYIDYVNIHMKMRNFEQGLKDIAKAKALTKRAPYWSASIYLLKGALLISRVADSGSHASKSPLDHQDYLKGKPLFVRGYKLAKKEGDERLVVYARRLLLDNFANIIAEDLEKSFYDRDSGNPAIIP